MNEKWIARRDIYINWTHFQNSRETQPPKYYLLIDKPRQDTKYYLFHAHVLE